MSNEPRYAWQPIEKGSVLDAQRGNTEAIRRFIADLRKSSLSEATVKSYESALTTIFNEITIPLMSVTSSVVDACVSELYRSNDWSKSHVSTVMTTLNRFFVWAKNNMYTSLTITIKNPITGKTSFTRPTTEPRASREVSKAVANNKPEAVKLLDKNKPATGTLRTTPITGSDVINDIENLRTVAITALLRGTNISAEELCELDVYDFTHTHITYQAHGNRNFMRICPLSIDVRNKLYAYLSSRNDSNSALFTSMDKPSERISLHEVRKCL